MTAFQGTTTCARNLPQHFNGCACRPGAPTAAEVTGIDLNATLQDAIDKAYEAGIAEGIRQAAQPAPATPLPVGTESYTCPVCNNGTVTDHATQVTSTCDVCAGRGLVPQTPQGQDTVTSGAYYGTTFYRSRPGVSPNYPYAMRFETSRDLSDDEISHLTQLIGYRYRTTIRGEGIHGWVRDSPRSFVVSADSTKTRREDLNVGFEEFEHDLDAMIRYGSPVRVTNRAGKGTKGTRLVEGFGVEGISLEIYYDDVNNDNDF